MKLPHREFKQRVKDGLLHDIKKLEVELESFVVGSNFVKCEHSKETAKRRTLSNGTLQFGFQCDSCGRWRAKKKSFFGFNEPLIEYEEMQADRNKAWKRCDELRNEIKNLRDKYWWSCYESYMTSESWKRKRSAVLRRDKGICQCCLSSDAQHVHHLRYPSDPGDFGKEPAFDLVSVCRDCHSDIHGREV